MQHYASKYFAHRPPPYDPGGLKVKSQLFQNMVILKLKGVTNVATW